MPRCELIVGGCPVSLPPEVHCLCGTTGSRPPPIQVLTDPNIETGCIGTVHLLSLHTPPPIHRMMASERQNGIFANKKMRFGLSEIIFPSSSEFTSTDLYLSTDLQDRLLGSCGPGPLILAAEAPRPAGSHLSLGQPCPDIAGHPGNWEAEGPTCPGTRVPVFGLWP